MSIDSRYGIGIHSGGDGDAYLYSSRVYGENPDNQDCPPGSPCDHCLDSVGIVMNQMCAGAHLDAQPKWFKLPFIKLCSSGMSGQGHYIDVEFINFDTSTKRCGAHQAVIGPWKGNSDVTGFSTFTRPVMRDVVTDALTYYKAPSQGWVNWEDCGIEFTCTGLYNIVARFENVVYSGSRPAKLTDTFIVTSNNKESTSVHTFEDSKCELIEDWNAFLCTDEFGLLIFDSLDEDRMDRSAQPIWVTGYELDNSANEVAKCKDPEAENEEDQLCFNNRLNAYMDMCWDGFYTCQKRE